MRDHWTADRVSLLQRLWDSGATAEAISAQLGGLSRAAVLGKIYRLRRSAQTSLAPQARLARRRIRQIKPPPPAPGSKPKRLLDLTNTCCRWPVTGSDARRLLFCGAPQADLAAGIPYCSYHLRRAYVIPPKRVTAAKRKAAPAAEQSDAALRPRRRYVWRAPVRHPAPRRR